tara:strand:- start:251 stop:655 length:405 start_codon:yes stop_codon:yes gene_type:complete
VLKRFASQFEQRSQNIQIRLVRLVVVGTVWGRRGLRGRGCRNRFVWISLWWFVTKPLGLIEWGTQTEFHRSRLWGFGFRSLISGCIGLVSSILKSLEHLAAGTGLTTTVFSLYLAGQMHLLLDSQQHGATLRQL